MKIRKEMVGWREWIRLPDLGLGPVQAKIDTGARTSALHAEEIRTGRRAGRHVVHFTVPLPGLHRHGESRLTFALLDERKVRSSNGSMELRPVIETSLALGERIWPIEITLTSRQYMELPMLLGRQALRGRVTVDPGRTCLTEFSRHQRRRKSRGR